jgi:uncharacterized protein YbjT (DUF2867 family)
MGGERLVVVTGATGRQGGAVRALTRQPESARARRLAELGAEVVRADMGSPDDLAAAFRGAYGAYSVQNYMISGIEAEITQGKHVADAARDVGVAHLVYGSGGTGAAGTGVGSWESKLEIEAHMRQLGIPVTVLRPMAFMELMTDKSFYPPVSVWHLMPALMGEDRPVGWISTDDLGRIAAHAFADPETFIGADLSLTSDVQSVAQCRKLWREAKGRAPRRFPMPVWAFERFTGRDLTGMWRWLRTGEIDLDPTTTRRILPTAVTVREYLGNR